MLSLGSPLVSVLDFYVRMRFGSELGLVEAGEVEEWHARRSESMNPRDC